MRVQVRFLSKLIMTQEGSTPRPIVIRLLFSTMLSLLVIVATKPTIVFAVERVQGN